METFDALAGPSRQVSKKRPDAGAERVMTDHEAVCRFRAALRVKPSPDGPLRKRLHFQQQQHGGKSF